MLRSELMDLEKGFFYLITLGRNEEYKIQLYPCRVGAPGSFTSVEEIGGDLRSGDNAGAGTEDHRRDYICTAQPNLCAVELPMPWMHVAPLRALWMLREWRELQEFGASHLELYWTALEVRNGPSIAFGERCRRLRAEECVQ